MTNQEAIEIIKTAIAQVEWDYPMDYAAAFDMVLKALENGWISVKDRLPEGGVLVLVAFDVDIGLGETREVDTAMRQEGVFCGGGLDNYLALPCEVDVTHWMPLPEPPKEG